MCERPVVRISTALSAPFWATRRHYVAGGEPGKIENNGERETETLWEREREGDGESEFASWL